MGVYFMSCENLETVNNFSLMEKIPFRTISFHLNKGRECNKIDVLSENGTKIDCSFEGKKELSLFLDLARGTLKDKKEGSGLNICVNSMLLRLCFYKIPDIVSDNEMGEILIVRRLAAE